jgi:alpha-methylacyl-CoA racemase
MFHGMRAGNLWNNERDDNLLDGGAHFYDTYETSDGKWIAVGAVEPQFYAIFLEKLGLTGDPDFAQQSEHSLWPHLKARLEAIFLTRTRDEWCALMEDTDICFAPVLSLAEAPRHPHNVARGTFIEVDGVIQPAPAPRFGATPAPPVRMREE